MIYICTDIISINDMYEDSIIPPDFGDPFLPKPTREELSRDYNRQTRSEIRQADYNIYRSAEYVSPAEPRQKTHVEITNRGDTTPAHDEYEFMKDLFPYQNIKGWNGKSGREFLADFTKATRGQLAVCMSRLAEENPKEFARLWVEMEKFNTPQQSSQQIEANITQKTDLYAQLQAMNVGFDPMSEEQEHFPDTGKLIDNQTETLQDIQLLTN